MTATLTVTSLERDPDTGRVHVMFNKVGREFSSLAAVREFVARELDQDTLIAIAVAAILDRVPNMDKANLAVGKSIVVDTSAANIVKVV